MVKIYENGIIVGKEPDHEQIIQHMQQHKENYYNSREQLRELAYGGKPPGGYASWGDYWKSL